MAIQIMLKLSIISAHNIWGQKRTNKPRESYLCEWCKYNQNTINQAHTKPYQ